MYESETSNLGTERCSKLEREIFYGHAENNRNWDCIFWYFFERRFVSDYCVFVTEFRVFTPEHRFDRTAIFIRTVCDNDDVGPGGIPSHIIRTVG